MVIALIPSRLSSKRLPGKALAIIDDRPVIIHAAQRASLASSVDQVVVCTDSPEIKSVCDQFNVNSFITTGVFNNGTERIASVISNFNSNFFVDVQGDEPLLDPSHIDSVVECLIAQSRNEEIIIPTIQVPYSSPETIVRVQSSVSNRVMTLSRSFLPYRYSGTTNFICKHLSIIGFTRDALFKYSSLDKSPNEHCEDIELLRALENDMRVFSLPLQGDSFSVDIHDDLLRARVAMKSDPYQGKY